MITDSQMREELGLMWNAIVPDADWETRLDQGHAIISYWSEKSNRMRLGSPLEVEHDGTVSFAHCIVLHWDPDKGVEEL